MRIFRCSQEDVCFWLQERRGQRGGKQSHRCIGVRLFGMCRRKLQQLPLGKGETFLTKGPIRIATRGSMLALQQSGIIKAALEKLWPEIRFELQIIKT